MNNSGLSSNNNQNNLEKNIKSLSLAELNKNLVDAISSQDKEKIRLLTNELLDRDYENKENGEKNETSLKKIQNLLNKKGDIKKSDIKKLLESHMREYNKLNSKNQQNNSTQNKTMQDLMKQLQESEEKKKELEQKYNEKLMEDEKMIRIINPVEKGRRKYLRKTLNKFKSFFGENPKKALAYFLTKTRFWKGGKIKASLKKASLFMKNLTNFSTMGEKQIIENKNAIQKAINDMNPQDNDSPTVKELKTQIKKEVAESANKYFDKISKPLETKIAA
ncbi:MAG: hypothetical protein PHR61_00430 [Candidatus Absconditabacteria bacterium]|nr:hypothetical protein [Candidatus Absconditabacteria bacterium]